jgi:hypothetical protein
VSQPFGAVANVGELATPGDELPNQVFDHESLLWLNRAGKLYVATKP